MRIVLQVAAGVLCAYAAPLKDKVEKLPGYGAPPTPQYSGFLDASATEPGTMLHYWFAEAVDSPKTAPVVLWLNGGPGSSSLLGFMQEVGPLLINEDGKLVDNPWSWTKLANVVALESPAGVGFSYCANSTKGGSCYNTDRTTAAAARAAMVDFFDKFPEYAHNKFYITGESYGGVYVPTLTKEILDNAPHINMAGLAVGDPCTNTDFQSESMDMLWYAHKHGFVPDAEFEFLWNNCSARVPHLLNQPIWEKRKGKWVVPEVTLQGLLEDLKESKECRLARRKMLSATSRAISQTWANGFINDLSLYGPFAVVPFDTPGSLNYAEATYLMREDVMAALHVSDSPTGAKKGWPGPSDGWVYVKEWNACNPAPKGTPSMIDFYRDIAPRLESTNVFNGDTDPCVSYEGTRLAVEAVGFPQLSGGAYRPWFYNETKADPSFLSSKPLLFGPDLSLRDAGAQFGGHVVSYQHNLSFITVHGSGHMVPQFRPQAGYHMLRKVLQGELLSPLFESDDALQSMDDSAFDKWLDQWTQSAKAAPFV